MNKKNINTSGSGGLNTSNYRATISKPSKRMRDQDDFDDEDNFFDLDDDQTPQ